MRKAVLFDLGGTLVQYFERSEWPGILGEGIAAVEKYLRSNGLPVPPPEVRSGRVAEENHEAPDYSVRPLEDRLVRIFFAGQHLGERVDAMCRAFMTPVFTRSLVYEDAVPVLQELRSRGLRLGIVSNTTWGSPASLWREEVARHGLTPLVDAVVFCRDCGWRKPARPIFDLAMSQVAATPAECLFVGDDPRWDIAGPRALGMDAVLIDRSLPSASSDAIPSLLDLLPRL